jgi:nitroreductase
MDVYQAITKRSTVYSFLDKQIKEEILVKLLDAARMSPAAGSIHEYEFIICGKKAKKTEISKICLTPKIDSAPYMIVVICDPEKLKSIFGLDGEEVFCVENVSLAIENLLLAATNEGLGSAWIATVKQEPIKQLLKIPDKYIVRGVIPLGYPSEEPSKQTQLLPKLSEITHVESFNNE